MKATPDREQALQLFDQLEESDDGKIGEFRISRLRVLHDHKFEKDIKRLPILLEWLKSAGMIKRWVMYEDVASMDKVLKIEKV